MPDDSDADVADANDSAAIELWESAKHLGSGPQLQGSQVDELLVRASNCTDDVSAETAVYASGLVDGVEATAP